MVPLLAEFLPRLISDWGPRAGRRCDFRIFAYKARVKTTPPEAGCPDPPPPTSSVLLVYATVVAL